MKLLAAIRLAWRYYRMSRDPLRWTYLLVPNVYHVNPEVSGEVDGWALGSDNDGQVVIYTEHYLAGSEV
ncbi:hypothetical protein LCGC14_2513270 [marine sediment metagenome]|uniref:Uncharacterized protein n=1 Tax=marine sediment metagenome TaxID=412755 RepID=A0A0F9BLG6_9ZZZZ